jgi:hypothetical protein
LNLPILHTSQFNDQLAVCLSMSNVSKIGGGHPAISCLDDQQEELFADLNLIRLPIIIVT